MGNVIKYKKRKKYVDAYTSYRDAIKWFFKNEKKELFLKMILYLINLFLLIALKC